MSPRELLCLAVGGAGLLAAAVLLWIRRRETRELEKLWEQVEHFLLYPDAPLEETLQEGRLANLENQFSKLEQQLLYQRETGRRSEEEMTRFVENMAHQMKNAVTALQIQMDLLAASEPHPSTEKSQACLDRLTDEIDRLLKSSQLAAGKIAMVFEPLELAGEIGICAENLADLARRRNIELRRTGPESLTLPADSFWLPQAVENILKNAVEHSPDGGTVTIRLIDEGRQVRLRVEDRGEGIPAQELPRLFACFHRGSVAMAGYGIGLSMAKDIVEAHHGALTAGNCQAGGAWFEMTLPLLDGKRPYA